VAGLAWLAASSVRKEAPTPSPVRVATGSDLERATRSGSPAPSVREASPASNSFRNGQPGPEPERAHRTERGGAGAPEGARPARLRQRAGHQTDGDLPTPIVPEGQPEAIAVLADLMRRGRIAPPDSLLRGLPVELFDVPRAEPLDVLPLRTFPLADVGPSPASAGDDGVS
jgi:hypothetical protein